ncbi:30S ribosomal protein S20 [Candidatus Dojkabacteria bacterium]|uniref:Small ribosomal subunit protein bS20 n=1 Tax=Candidatus Dojkabacteria bacterium TaxID=2099670 RepID=A0A955RJS0_9BACT|nr:30S ribosomal protein S20 [Candidatus Dojkabacteria bacterium]
MANTSSAKKAIRSSAKKNVRNSIIRKKFRVARKEVRDAVAAGNKKEAEKKMPAAFKHIDKAAKKNILHKNTAARYKSRLAQAVKNLSEK